MVRGGPLPEDEGGCAGAVVDANEPSDRRQDQLAAHRHVDGGEGHTSPEPARGECDIPGRGGETPGHRRSRWRRRKTPAPRARWHPARSSLGRGRSPAPRHRAHWCRDRCRRDRLGRSDHRRCSRAARRRLRPGTADLVTPENITPVFLPPYSPALNASERLWPQLKEGFLAHRRRPDDDIVDAVGRARQRVTSDSDRCQSLCSMERAATLRHQWDWCVSSLLRRAGPVRGSRRRRRQASRRAPARRRDPGAQRRGRPPRRRRRAPPDS